MQPPFCLLRPLKLCTPHDLPFIEQNSQSFRSTSLTITAIYQGNDHNYHIISKSHLGSVTLLAEVTWGRESGVWSHMLIVSLTWWLRSPLRSSVFLTQKDKENAYLGWHRFWKLVKHVTSSKHSRNTTTHFIKDKLQKRLGGCTQKRLPGVWIMGADFGSQVGTRNTGGTHKQHSKPRCWVTSERQRNRKHGEDRHRKTL